MFSVFRLLRLCVLLFVILKTVASLCPYECECADEPTSCPAGVSLITDGCNCCKVCARQRDEQCNDNNQVCDEHRNLMCDFTASKSGDWGICRPRSGRACWSGDVLVTSGSMFEPSCKQRCWCIDGAVGCVPSCPHEAKVPLPERCPNARLRSAPGQCCDQWTCDSPSGDVFTLPLDDFWNEYVDDQSEDPNRPLDSSSTADLSNGIRDGIIYEDDVGENTDEFRDYQINANPDVDLYLGNLEDNWHESNIIPGDMEAQVQAARNYKEKTSNCRFQASAWSPCSKSCGLGVSTRVTNSNLKCQLVREQRLCETRPCNDFRYTPKTGRQCLRQKRSRKRVTLKYAGCVSLRKTRPRYCGSCHDDGKCCTPKTTRTSRIHFRCEDGPTFSKNMLIVRSCHCHNNCASFTSSQPPLVLQAVGAYSLFGDMHRSDDR